MEKIIKKIETLPLFRGIEGQSLASLFEGIQYYEKHYAKGSALILQGMPYKALYIITEGKCFGQMSGASGKILKIEDFEAPYALAGPLLFADDNRIPVTLWAKTDVDLLIFKKEDLLSLCHKNKQFMVNLINDMANKFTFISSKLMYLQFKSLEDKILYYLSRQVADSSGWIKLKQSIQELSTLFGVERPSLSRALSRMEDDGVIEKAGKKIRISE
ncbi:MAG: Crp/Fnr family transcriptional regulator [Spirochaetales bacterium]|nr:Crp/Fnr family transcriptional regulator [Spirochaetales bacterium]